MAKTERICACLAGFGGSVALIIFAVLLLLRLDSSNSMSWYAVFSPLWIAFFFWGWSVAVALGSFIDDRDPFDLPINNMSSIIWFLCVSACCWVFAVLLPIRLESATWASVSWSAIFVPLWLFLLLLFLVSPDWPRCVVAIAQGVCVLVSCWFKYEFHSKEGSDMEETFLSVLPVHFLTCILAVTVLTAIKLDTQAGWLSWSLVFVPAWAFLSLLFCLFCTQMVIARQPSIFAWLLGLFFVASIIFSVLLVCFLEGAVGYLSFSFIPVFLGLLLLLCVSCGCLCW